MGAPQRTRGAYVNVQMAAAAGDSSGMEIETLIAASDGLGIFIEYIGVDIAHAYGMTISAASLFDQAVAVITPTCIFGVGALTSIVREGQDSAGAVAGEGDFLFTNGAAASAPFGNFAFSGSIYVPAGKFVTIRRTAVNLAANITVGFSEAISP